MGPSFNVENSSKVKITPVVQSILDNPRVRLKTGQWTANNYFQRSLVQTIKIKCTVHWVSGGLNKDVLSLAGYGVFWCGLLGVEKRLIIMPKFTVFLKLGHRVKYVLKWEMSDNRRIVKCNIYAQKHKDVCHLTTGGLSVVGPCKIITTNSQSY